MSTREEAEWVEPEPGDPDGDSRKWSVQLGRACRIEYLDGWEFKRTWAYEGEPFDPDLPPDGGGWVRNTQAGTDGYEVVAVPGRRPQQISYWRRKEVTL